jgi:dTDP-4-amino-4,6-dideoxygalactose transaminase
MMIFRTHGITRLEDHLLKNDGPWYYEQHALGYNYRLTDIQCALGSSQMKHLDDFIEKRRSLVDTYTKLFSDVDAIILPTEAEYSKSGWHIYVIQLELDKLNGSRREIYEALQKENIGVNVHYIPVYYHPYYQSLGYDKGLCPVAETLYEKILTLPLFPTMTTTDVEDVVNGLKKVLDYYRK